MRTVRVLWHLNRDIRIRGIGFRSLGGWRLPGAPVIRPATGDDDTLLITVDRLSGTARRLGVFRRANEVVQVSGGLFLLALDRLALLEATWAQFGAILSGATARSAIKLPGVDVVAGVDQAN